MNRKRWGIEVKIALLQKGLHQSDLADMFGVSRQHMTDVVNHRRGYPQTEMVKKISDYLGIEYPEERGEDDS